MSTKLSTTLAETTPAAASTVIGKSIFGMDRFEAYAIYASLVGASGGTLDVYLQTSFDEGVTWYDVAHFPQLGASAAAVTYVAQYSPTITAPTAVGKGSAVTAGVALAVGTYTGGPLGDSIRAVYVAGTSTSAGAAISIDFVGFISP